ncbi:bromodomain-containing RNA-binding protein [Trifolium pratense]|uniref:Bromodomain-containing RNA-binding protein n=1 Tax=Trifolium pratense TaxID=57577 RepID=A0A2K3N6H7_TRIPR|nr:bromodomain-containing RNA-binding protein [Trifolium pratense]
MMEGRDGWALKAPLDIKFLKGLENKSKLKKAIGLKDIEGKLKSDDVFKVVARLSDTFEHKWKVLKEEWALKEKRLKYKNHKRKRKLYHI